VSREQIVFKFYYQKNKKQSFIFVIANKIFGTKRQFSILSARNKLMVTCCGGMMGLDEQQFDGMG